MALVLPLLLWMLLNATLNRHSHLTATGTLVSHAHPFEKKQEGSSPFQSHSHTTREYLLLDLFHTILFSLGTAGAVMLFRQEVPISPLIGATHKIPCKEHYQVYHYHAPPLAT
jgi:hypothetical protein